MENTYIKSTGTANLYLQENGNNHSSNVGWNVDYDGDVADIKMDVDYDGEKDRINLVLDNHDLADLLQTPVVKKSLDERLYNDYLVDRKVYKLAPEKRRQVVTMKRRRPIQIFKLKRGKSRKSSKRSKKTSKRTSTSRKSSKGKRSNKRSSSKSSRTTPRPKTKRIHLSRRGSKRTSRSSRSSRSSK